MKQLGTLVTSLLRYRKVADVICIVAALVMLFMAEGSTAKLFWLGMVALSILLLVVDLPGRIQKLLVSRMIRRVSR